MPAVPATAVQKVREIADDPSVGVKRIIFDAKIGHGTYYRLVSGTAAPGTLRKICRAFPSVLTACPELEKVVQLGH